MTSHAIGFPGRHGLAAALLILALLAAPTAVSQETYIQELSAQLGVAQEYLDAAGDAIRDCDSAIVTCLQNPEGYATRIDAAVAGLIGVQGNLSAMAVPPIYAQDHALLVSGFGKVTDGLALYAQGIRQGEPDQLSAGADLIHDGKVDIETASSRILAKPPGGEGLFLILIAAIIVIAGALLVLMVVVYRQAASGRRDRIERELATCPVCGEVLDGWRTYRTRQIRDWREAHLKSHAQDRAGKPGAKD